MQGIASCRIASRFVLALASLLMSAAAFASDWKYYDASQYGFSMNVPAGAGVVTREWGGGWGGITGVFEGVRFHGLAKLGAKESNEDIERYAVNIIGVPAGAWTRVDTVSNTRGWERGAVFRANVGGRVLFGMYGVGPRGNYLLYLDTSAEDYAAYKAEFDNWYTSIRLN
jgi:hypothetical protein